MKYPKSLLHEFYQLHDSVPIFEVESINERRPDAQFRCRLFCPGVQSTEGAFPDTTFEGEGLSKKAAEHAASSNALKFIREAGLLPAAQDASPPSDVADIDEQATVRELRLLRNRCIVLAAQIEARLSQYVECPLRRQSPLQCLVSQ